MIEVKELRIGNIVTWNPALINPAVTLPPMQVEVFSIMQNKINYVFPNIENRVEPFEDDVVKMGVGEKSVEELEPIILTPEILQTMDFEEKGGFLASKHVDKGDLQLKYNGEYFQRVSVTKMNTTVFELPIKYFHQLQNLYYALTGEELEIKLHGQQT
jgi:hypothetical protein